MSPTAYNHWNNKDGEMVELLRDVGQQLANALYKSGVQVDQNVLNGSPSIIHNNFDRKPSTVMTTQSILNLFLRPHVDSIPSFAHNQVKQIIKFYRTTYLHTALLNSMPQWFNEFYKDYRTPLPNNPIIKKKKSKPKTSTKSKRSASPKRTAARQTQFNRTLKYAREVVTTPSQAT